MTKNIKVNARYKSEKSIAADLDMQAVVGSGSNWEKGREDFIGKKDDPRLGQSKSTGRRNAVLVRYLDLFQLWKNAHKAGKDFPIFVLEFETPMVNTDDGQEVALPEKERWVAMPFADYKLLWATYIEKLFS